MAIRYANFDLATGANDGTSEADAWQTWAAVLAGEAAGDYLYVKKTASRHTEGAAASMAIDFSLWSGTGDELSVIEGYETTPGDGVQFQTGNRMRLQTSSVHLRNFDMLVDDDSNPIISTQGSDAVLENFKVVQQGRHACVSSSSLSTAAGGYLQLKNCELERNLDGGAGSSASHLIVCGSMHNVKITDARVGAGTTSTVAINNTDGGFFMDTVTIKGPGSTSTAIYFDQNTDELVHIKNVSIYNFRYAFQLPASTASDFCALVHLCAVDTVTDLIFDAGTVRESAYNWHDIIYNSLSGSVNNGGTATQNLRNVVDAGGPIFVSPGSGDFTPTSTLTDLAVTGFLGNSLTPGAIQPAAGGGGGGVEVAGETLGLLPISRISEVG